MAQPLSQSVRESHLVEQLRGAGFTDTMWRFLVSGKGIAGVYRTVVDLVAAEYSMRVSFKGTVKIHADTTAEALVEDVTGQFATHGFHFSRFDYGSLDVIRDDLEKIRGRKLQILEYQSSQPLHLEHFQGFQRAIGFNGSASAFVSGLVDSSIGASLTIPNETESYDAHVPFFHARNKDQLEFYRCALGEADQLSGSPRILAYRPL